MKGTLLGYFFLLMVILIAWPYSSMANEFPPSHMCFKPKPPLFLASHEHREQFSNDTLRYESCLKKFIQEQHEAIRMHESAIEQTKQEWDKFSQKNKK